MSTGEQKDMHGQEDLKRKNIRMKVRAWTLLNEAADRLNQNPAVILESLILKHIDDLGDQTNDRTERSKG